MKPTQMSDATKKRRVRHGSRMNVNATPGLDSRTGNFAVPEEEVHEVARPFFSWLGGGKQQGSENFWSIAS
jgi:hypothetical protein